MAVGAQAKNKDKHVNIQNAANIVLFLHFFIIPPFFNGLNLVRLAGNSEEVY